MSEEWGEEEEEEEQIDWYELLPSWMKAVVDAVNHLKTLNARELDIVYDVIDINAYDYLLSVEPLIPAIVRLCPDLRTEQHADITWYEEEDRQAIKDCIKAHHLRYSLHRILRPIDD